MTTPTLTPHRKTIPTADPDAQKLNQILNDVDRFAEIGHHLNKLLQARFQGDSQLFRQWCRANLDRSELTLIRYMKLAEEHDALRQHGMVRPKDAYKFLRIDQHTSLT